jgi:hypothetical protein
VGNNCSTYDASLCVQKPSAPQLWGRLCAFTGASTQHILKPTLVLSHLTVRQCAHLHASATVQDTLASAGTTLLEFYAGAFQRKTSRKFKLS